VAVSVSEAADEPGDGFGLVAAGLVVAGKLEFHGGPPLGRKLECSKLFIIRYLSKGARPGQKAQIKARKPQIPLLTTENTEKAQSTRRQRKQAVRRRGAENAEKT
jgi:hypothetical protein